MSTSIFTHAPEQTMPNGQGHRGGLAVDPDSSRVASPPGPLTPSLAACRAEEAEQRRGSISTTRIRWTTEEVGVFDRAMAYLRAAHPGVPATVLARRAQENLPAHRRMAKPLKNRGVSEWPRMGAEKVVNKVGRVRSPNRLVHPRKLLLQLGVPRQLIRTRKTRRYMGAWWDAQAERLHDLHRLATRNYREKIKVLHPDHEGDAEQAAALTNVYKRWRKLFAKQCRMRGWNE